MGLGDFANMALNRILGRVGAGPDYRAEHDAWLRQREEFYKNIRGGGGWHYWMNTAPPRGAGLIEIARQEWPTSKVVDRDDLRPEMNVADLWWRQWKGDTIKDDIIEVKALLAPVDSN